MYRVNGIEIEVEFQDVDAGLAEEAELAGFGVFGDERIDVGFAHVAFASDARGLKRRGLGRDVRIEARAGRGEQVHGDRLKRSAKK